MAIDTTPFAAAWAEAYRKVEASIPAKDLKHVLKPTSPDDIIPYLDKWMSAKETRSGKVLSVLQDRTARLQRFSSALDQVSQGMPQPAGLIWGSIRFALTLVQDNLDEYEKICTALATILDSLPRVDLYTKSFTESQLIKDCVTDLFAAILHFWIKACKFYRRRRLWTLMRNTWTDYDIEFARLELVMNRNLRKLEKGASAEHIAASNTFMAEQRSNMLAFRQAREEDLRKEFIASLAPPDGDINDFAREHETIRRQRHGDTCGWILDHPLFKSWSEITPDQHATLWITAGPGAGKSTLTSYIADHLNQSTTKTSSALAIFYFKSSSPSQNNAADAMSSLVWQLYAQSEAVRNALEEYAFLEMSTDGLSMKAGIKTNRIYKASERLEVALRTASGAVIIVDGLDECEDCDEFIPQLIELCRKANVKTILTSRREERIASHLQTSPTLQILPSDIQSDIEAFSESKVSRSARLSHPLVRADILDALASRHDGMFLWVALMLKELKACVTVEDVQSTLSQLPIGLEAVYGAIIHRLETTLTRRAMEVCRKVLAWVLGSGRPLAMNELHEALCQQYELSGQTLLASGQFPYADQEIELICGSLVKVQYGKIQPVHETTTAFIELLATRNQSLTSLRILPTKDDTSVKLAAICLAYIADRGGTPITNLTDGVLKDEKPDIEGFRNGNPFIEYACSYWAYHILECPWQSRDEALALMKSALTCSTTLSWIEISFLLGPSDLWRLTIAGEELEDWLNDMEGDTKIDDSQAMAMDWCVSLLGFLKSYGSVLNEYPWIAWLNCNIKFPNHGKDAEYCSKCRVGWGGQDRVLEESLVPRTQAYKIPAKARLGHDQSSLMKARFGFIVHERHRNVYITGEMRTRNGEQLFVQETATGRRLPPVTAPTKNYGYVMTAKISSDGRYLAIVYNSWLSVWTINSQIYFSQRLRTQQWATRLFEHEHHDTTMGSRLDSVAFGEGNTLYVPGGWYDLPSTKLNMYTPSQQADVTPSVRFSGDGKFTFEVTRNDGHTRVRRIATTPEREGNSKALLIDLDAEWRIVASYAGTYLLLLPKGSRREGKPRQTQLLHVESQKVSNIGSGLRHMGEGSFHFTHEDSELVTFLLGPRLENSCHAKMTITVWQLDGDTPTICSTRDILVVDATHPALINNDPVCTIDGVDRGWIVSCKRIVQEVRFSRKEIQFPDHVPEADSRYLWASRLSKDGTRLGNAKVMGHEVVLQIIDLTCPQVGETVTERRFHLPNTDYLPGSTPVVLSPGLDLLVVGSTAFTLDTVSGAPTQTPIALGDDLEFIDHSDSHRDWSWDCEISNCGSYIAFEKPAFKHFADSYDRQPGRSLLIHVDRNKREAKRMQDIWKHDPSSDKAARPGLIVFHASKPLATFSALCGPGNDYNQGHPREPEIPATECSLALVHLDDNRAVPIESPKIEGNLNQRLHISDSGTFTYMEVVGRESDSIKQRLLISNLECSPEPFLCLSSEREAHPDINRCYELDMGNGAAAIGISMYSFKSNDPADKFPRLQTSVHRAHIRSLSFTPAEYGWRVPAWLLLGQDHSQPLKLLLFPQNGRPPVLKTLPHSWNDVQGELERQYAEYVCKVRQGVV